MTQSVADAANSNSPPCVQSAITGSRRRAPWSRRFGRRARRYNRRFVRISCCCAGQSHRYRRLEIICYPARHKLVETACETTADATTIRLYNRTESPDDSRLYAFRDGPATAACTFGDACRFSSSVSRALDGDFGLQMDVLSTIARASCGHTAVVSGRRSRLYRRQPAPSDAIGGVRVVIV